MAVPGPEATKIVLCSWHPFRRWQLPRAMADAVRARWPGLQVVHLAGYERLAGEVEDARIFVGSYIEPDVFARAAKLMWVHSTATGVGQLLHEPLRKSAVIVTNARSVHAIPVAEHTIGLAIAVARRFPDAVRHQGAHHWGQQEVAAAVPSPAELQGAEVLMIGLGAIGREVAARLRPFGVTIRAVTRSGRPAPDLAAEVAGPDGLRRMLPRADLVIVSAPATDRTHHLIGASELAAMKPSAFLVNVSRGSLVDGEALVEALREGRIAGAALDVAEEEPLPAESPLWDAPNLLITPHVSAVSDRLWERQTALLIDNLERWFAGRELLHLVDKTAGY